MANQQQQQFYAGEGSSSNVGRLNNYVLGSANGGKVYPTGQLLNQPYQAEIGKRTLHTNEFDDDFDEDDNEDEEEDEIVDHTKNALKIR